MHRADAGVELLLTDDPERADAIASELDEANAQRRARRDAASCSRPRRRSPRAAEQPAYVLASEDWHPGVIGIVASRIAERHHRPRPMIALAGDEGTGSGRSIPGFDLLGGLDAVRRASAPLRRPPGGRRPDGGRRRGRRPARGVRRARRVRRWTRPTSFPRSGSTPSSPRRTPASRSPRSSGGSRRSAWATRDRCC